MVESARVCWVRVVYGAQTAHTRKPSNTRDARLIMLFCKVYFAKIRKNTFFLLNIFTIRFFLLSLHCVLKNVTFVNILISKFMYQVNLCIPYPSPYNGRISDCLQFISLEEAKFFVYSLKKLLPSCAMYEIWYIQKSSEKICVL